MKKILAAVALLALPATAQAASFECKTTNFGRGGWIPGGLILAYDEKSGAGSVYDPFIHTIHKAPIPVEWEKTV